MTHFVKSFVPYVGFRGSPAERFARKCSEPDPNGCVLWLAAKDHNGYGRFAATQGPRVAAHRFAYEQAKGAIPDGLVIDHLCRVPACVNPLHLEAVTNQENVLRGALGRLRTECRHGHPYEGENIVFTRLGYRKCRECQRINSSEYYYRVGRHRRASRAKP